MFLGRGSSSPCIRASSSPRPQVLSLKLLCCGIQLAIAHACVNSVHAESVLTFGAGTSIYHLLEESGGLKDKAYGFKIHTDRQFNFAYSFGWQKWWYRPIATDISLAPEPLLPQLGVGVLVRVPSSIAEPFIGVGYHAAVGHNETRFQGGDHHSIQLDWMASAGGSVFLSRRTKLWLAIRYLKGGLPFGYKERYPFPWGYSQGYQLFVTHVLLGVGLVLP